MGRTLSGDASLLGCAEDVPSPRPLCHLHRVPCHKSPQVQGVRMADKTERQRREDARLDLIRAIEQLGYPEEFGVVIASQLGGEKSMRRMTSYLRGAKPRSPEEIADEMLAILESRSRWVETKISQRANDSLTAFYNRPREASEEYDE